MTPARAPVSKREMDSLQRYGDWMNQRILKVLCTRFYHRNADGSLFTLRIQDAVMFAPSYHIVMLDPEALWRFPKDELAGQDVLDALTSAVQRPVRFMTCVPGEAGQPARHGIAYVVSLQKPK